MRSAFLVLGLIVVMTTYGYMTSSRHLVFSSGACSQADFDPDYIKDVSWQGDSLGVTTVVHLTCAVKGISGDYHVDGDVLTLTVDVPPQAAYAMCDCAYENSYVIRGLEKKDYAIRLVEADKTADQLRLAVSNEVSDSCDMEKSYQCYDAALRRFVATTTLATAGATSTASQSTGLTITYGSEDLRKAIESHPTFLTYFKEYELHTSSALETATSVRFTLDSNRIRYTISFVYDTGARSEQIASLPMVSQSIVSALDSYAAEKEVLDGAKRRLESKLGIHIVYYFPNETGFAFLSGKDRYSYRGPLDPSGRAGSIEFSNEQGETISLSFNDGFPPPSELTQSEFQAILKAVGIARTALVQVERTHRLTPDSSAIRSRRFPMSSPTQEIHVSLAKKNFTIDYTPLEIKDASVRIHSRVVPLRFYGVGPIVHTENPLY